jgi:hypothetical protein
VLPAPADPPTGTGRSDWASTPSWDPRTEKLEDVGEADVVFDVIGEDILDRSATLVGADGTLVTTTLLRRVRPKDGVKGKTSTLVGRRLPAPNARAMPNRHGRAFVCAYVSKAVCAANSSKSP